MEADGSDAREEGLLHGAPDVDDADDDADADADGEQGIGVPDADEDHAAPRRIR